MKIFFIYALSGASCWLMIAALSMALFGSGSAMAGGSRYLEGWQDGYEAGYCYRQGPDCMAPIVPPAPPTPITDDDSYQAGYNAGFVAGVRDSNEPDLREIVRRVKCKL